MKTILPPLHSRAGQRLLGAAAVAFIFLLIALQYGVHGFVVAAFLFGAVRSFLSGGGGSNIPPNKLKFGPTERDIRNEPIFSDYPQNIWHRFK